MKVLSKCRPLLLITVVAATLTCGCRSVKKSSSSSIVTSDTGSVKKSSSGQLSKTDSIGMQRNIESKKTEQNSASDDQVKVVFKGDTAKAERPVIITQNADGSLTIDPGGRQLESVETSRKRQEQKKDSTGTSQVNKGAIVKVDSIWQNNSDSTASNHTDIDNNSSTNRSYPWYVWIIGAVVICALFCLLTKYI